MKLSICIPVYNFDVGELVRDLNKEIKTNRIDAEIILIDDASDESFRQVNNVLQNEVQNFIFLEKNIGRSKIRNLFLNHSNGEYLLFLDCDVKTDNNNFLKNYLSEIYKNPKIEAIYGNFKISETHSKSLRNLYSVKREIFSGNVSADFSRFKTVNFIIKRDIFEKFPFNEELTEYGYEDFVFAKLLEMNNVKFLAINNPIVHFDDTENDVFLKKIETGIDSLLKLSKNPRNEVFIKDVKVYDTAMKLKKTGLDSLFLFLYNFAEERMKKNLLSDSPNVRYLDFYKLGLLLKKIRG